MIKLVSFGSGNIQAIANIYSTLGIAFGIASSPAELSEASKLVLPGVGAFDQVMGLLEKSDMLDELNRLVLEKNVPVLGVCVGMQIMANRSEEGTRKGLGWIDADVARIDTRDLNVKPRLPHMGWNSIQPTTQHPMFNNVDCQKGFYFLHSYCFSCRDERNVLSYSQYGQQFPSSVYSGSIFGFQFHPEKSHANGINIFKNFAAL